MTIVVLQRVMLALVVDAVTGPLWWYTGGLAFIVTWWKNSIASSWQSVGVGVWFKNLFVPMFGQYDLQGRFISFFVRLFQIIVRSIGFLIWAIGLSLVVVLWVAAPVIAFWFFMTTLF